MKFVHISLTLLPVVNKTHFRLNMFYLYCKMHKSPSFNLIINYQGMGESKYFKTRGWHLHAEITSFKRILNILPPFVKPLQYINPLSSPSQFTQNTRLYRYLQLIIIIVLLQQACLNQFLVHQPQVFPVLCSKQLPEERIRLLWIET